MALHAGYSHSVMRLWHSKERVRKSDMVYPIFVSDDEYECREIKNFPGQFIMGTKSLRTVLEKLVPKGLKSVLIFGVLSDKANPKEEKDNIGSLADKEYSPTVNAIKFVKSEFPGLLVIADVCLCAYTDHGHCGVLTENGYIDNEASVRRLSEIAAEYGKAGADVVAPSDMMDGRVKAIKKALKREGLPESVAIMSYSAKFASELYGPFRGACESGVKDMCRLKDRKSYQLPPMSTDLAIKAAMRDQKEGADFLMVKPAGFYLDVLGRVSARADVPVAAYQVSGEYSMIVSGANNGVFDLKRVILESLNSMKRAGASILISYFTPEVLDILEDGDFE